MAPSYLSRTKHFETILDFLRFGLSEAHERGLFYGHGTDNAWDDITALVLGCLYLPLDSDSFFYGARLTQEEKIVLAEKLEQRITHRVPVPYLTHTAYFCGLPFYVDERVLIPRSPIAELIEQHFAPWVEEKRVRRILDLCTGSGCIAIACATAFPNAEVVAVDISKDALAVAEKNCSMHALKELSLLESDCFQQIPPGEFDIIVSNPPYVGKEEMQTLPLEYGHEPHLALEALNNGLAIVERILHEASAYLSERGILVVEVGNTEEALLQAYPDVPFTWLEFERGGQGVFLLTKHELEIHFGGG